ncbi:MAG: hypothetical protein HN380_10530 [Victivallales bacterium]|nr:hypothetical protein [Victivallales bacterium]
MDTARFARRSFLSLLFLAPLVSLGWASFRKTVPKGSAVPVETAKRLGWPKGVLELANDPVRTEGWSMLFGFGGGDTPSYYMDVTTSEDVQRLVDLLSEIEADRLRIVLNPERGARPPVPPRRGAEDEDGAGVVFAIRSQAAFKPGFQRLPAQAGATRQGGKLQLVKPPAAFHPTLTIYTGSRAVDLDTLVVPLNIEVLSAVKPSGTHLDDFVAKHEGRRRAAKAGKPPQPAP